MMISQIAALSENLVIGRDNQLPWSIPEDLKYFRTTTLGHICILGRKTFESVGSKPLPRRLNIVVTRNPMLKEQFTGVPNLEFVGSVADALALSAETLAQNPGLWPDEVFVCGGGDIFREAMPQTDRLYLTEIRMELAGDAFFPAFAKTDFLETRRVAGSPAGANGELKFDFVIYDRVVKNKRPTSV
jgi:dihydrofolate reductase